MKNITQMLDDVGRALEQLPNRVAATAVKFSKDRFVAQNWKDESETPWDKRSSRRRGGSKRQKGAVLVDSGKLKRSIRVISADRNKVVIGSDVPYAEIHNEGLDESVTVQAHTRLRNGKTSFVEAHTRKMKMPQRRFLGESQALANEIEAMIQAEIEKAINQ